MTSSVGDLLDLDITGIAHGGTFVARHDGRVVFVSDAIPGERVRARVTDSSKASFWRAETVEVLDASPHRQPHIWREADVSRDPERRAGGADLGHITIEHQRTLKRQVLQEALDRFAGGGLDAPEIAAVGDGSGTGWRTRMTLHVDADGKVGPYAARSHRVIPVRSYPLASQALADAALAITGGEPGRIDLVQAADGRVRVMALPDGGRRPKSETIRERVGSRSFRVDSGGFWQVHAEAASTLDAAVSRMLQGRVDPKDTHYDLYGGVGLFAATLADLGAKHIVTVESSHRATTHAAQNLLPLTVTAMTARVDRYLSSLETDTTAGAVVLDPPRAGAGRSVVDSLTKLAPKSIVYVACDPVALARDLGTFRDAGWKVEALEAFDLFPNSHHFETVALLQR